MEPTKSKGPGRTIEEVHVDFVGCRDLPTEWQFWLVVREEAVGTKEVLAAFRVVRKEVRWWVYEETPDGPKKSKPLAWLPGTADHQEISAAIARLMAARGVETHSLVGLMDENRT